MSNFLRFVKQKCCVERSVSAETVHKEERRIMPVQASSPVNASFPSEKITVGAGVAIFHIATARVVLVYHTRDKYWFLPKGRRNANEATESAAEREGFEESGYRNRLIPLPLKHRQPDPDEGRESFVKEPIWTQFLPLTTTSQYLLFWYAAETIPREIEESYSSSTRPYQMPPAFPPNTTLKQRITADNNMDDSGACLMYEPLRHEGTGVDEEERLYTSYLLPIADAKMHLGGTVMEDVVRRGWEAIQLRLQMEENMTS